MQRSLDGFTLIELVGFGGTGEVWRARPDGGGPEVALRWLADETIDTELLSGSRLRDFEHPHLVRLLDLRRDGSSVVLVEDFIPGISLAALLTERDRLSSAEVVTLLTPVADALGAAHDAGLLHGNLTPTAVLFTPDGRPMVTELGVWQSLRGPTSGTQRLDYLDPAVARGGPLNQASDVFGVAAIGFHALTGRPPWAAGSRAATWQLAAESEGVDLRPLNAGPPSRLAEVIARGLSRQPGLRGSAQDFAADVRDALEPEPLHLAGPYAWPDLAPLPEDPGPADRPAATNLGGEDTALIDTALIDTGRMDIAGEVRRGGSARHAAAPSTRRERAPQGSAVRGVGQHPPSRLRRAARVVPRRAVVGTLVALAILGVIVLSLGWNSSKAVPAQAGGPIGIASGQASGEEPGTGTGGPGSGIDERAVPDSPEAWVALLSLLYERRAAAFTTGAVPLLDLVFTADSPQLVTDATELTRLVAAGQVLRGFAPRVLEIGEVSVDGDHATLQLSDEFSDYETVPAADPRAAAVANQPGRGPATVRMTLVLTEDGWRIHAAQRLD